MGGGVGPAAHGLRGFGRARADGRGRRQSGRRWRAAGRPTGNRWLGGLGPYLGKNGSPVTGAYVNLLPAGSDGNPGQGGQAFFKENGQYYMIYHAYQPPSGASLLNVRPIYFDATDWVTLDPCLAKGYRP